MTQPTSALEILKQLVAIDTSNQKGISQGLKWLKTWAAAQAISVKTFSQTKAILLETHPGGQRHFSFVAHLDVVPADNWKRAFTPTLKKNFLFGRGTVDDKGPLAVTLDTLLRARNFNDLNVSCLIVTDEETTNQEIDTIIKSKRFKPDLCLVVDGGTHSLIDIGQKGIIRCSIGAKTKGGHSAFEKKEDSAAWQLTSLIRNLELFGQKQPTNTHFQPTFINVSSLVTETVPYGLPTLATGNLEIQFPPPQTSKLWLREIDRLLKKFPAVSLKVHWMCEPHIVDSLKWTKFFSQFKGVKCITTGGANIAKDLCLASIPAVSHCPVSEYIAHCEDEKISLDDLDRGVKTYLKWLKRFSQSDL